MKTFKVSKLIGTREVLEKAKHELVDYCMDIPIVSINLKTDAEIEVEVSGKTYQENVDLFSTIMIKFGQLYSKLSVLVISASLFACTSTTENHTVAPSQFDSMECESIKAGEISNVKDVSAMGMNRLVANLSVSEDLDSTKLEEKLQCSAIYLAEAHQDTRVSVRAFTEDSDIALAQIYFAPDGEWGAKEGEMKLSEVIYNR